MAKKNTFVVTLFVDLYTYISIFNTSANFKLNKIYTTQLLYTQIRGNRGKNIPFNPKKNIKI